MKECFYGGFYGGFYEGRRDGGKEGGWMFLVGDGNQGIRPRISGDPLTLVIERVYFKLSK